MGDDGLYAALIRRGMSRRSFLQFSAAMAAALALPATYAPRIAAAVEAAPRIPVIWLRGQSCGGNTEALLRSADPPVAELLLETLSVEYHDSFLAAAGGDAELVRTTAMERYPDGYFAVIEGAIPTGGGGASCLVGGRPMADVAREVADGALATIALGSCAFDGGLAGASGDSTGAEGVRNVITGGRLVTLPGCPMNVVNLAATISHYLAAGELPPTDPMGRPLFAYGGLIHNQCERRPHFEFGEFALTWGDEGAQKGWCLYKLGCKGPETLANCPTARYGAGVSWAVRAGAGCIGCVMPGFWDSMLPAYRRLGSPVPFLPGLTADQVGGALVAGIGAVALAHGAGMTVRQRQIRASERRAAAAAVEAAAMAEVAAGEPIPAGALGEPVSSAAVTEPGAPAEAPEAAAEAPETAPQEAGAEPTIAADAGAETTVKADAPASEADPAATKPEALAAGAGPAAEAGIEPEGALDEPAQPRAEPTPGPDAGPMTGPDDREVR